MSETILEALNHAVARELSAIVQYMWQHVMAEGMESQEISELFENVSIAEMKHTERFAERIDYLGGVPTTNPTEIKMGGDLTKMIQNDLEIEREAIQMYKAHIKLCIEEGDPVTRLMYEEILTDEEEHEHQWKTILSKK